MRVVKQREGGIVRRVVLLDDSGYEVVPVNRFLSHLVDAGCSPNTVCAYGYDPAAPGSVPDRAVFGLERLPSGDGA